MIFDPVELFPPIVWKGKYEFDWDSLELVANTCLDMTHLPTNLEHGNARSSVGITGKGNILSEFQPHKRKELFDFVEWIETPIREIMEKWTYGSNLPIKIFNSWVNEHYRGGYTEEHVHPLVNFVVTAYLKVPENSGNILIRDPFFEMRSMEPLVADRNQWKEIVLKDNDVLIFPGWLPHKTQVSETDERRVVLTMNVIVDRTKIEM